MYSTAVRKLYVPTYVYKLYWNPVLNFRRSCRGCLYEHKYLHKCFHDNNKIYLPVRLYQVYRFVKTESTCMANGFPYGISYELNILEAIKTTYLQIHSLFVLIKGFVVRMSTLLKLLHC